MRDPYTLLALPDMHVPDHDSASLDAILQYASDQPFDEFIQLGDFLNLDSVSGHNPDATLIREGARIKDDLDAGNEVLDQIDEVLDSHGRKVVKTLIKGNHEWRLDRYIEKNPALFGQLSIEEGLHLRERGYNYVRSYPHGELYQVGHAHFFHGIFCSGNHAKRHVERYGVNIFYGHVHSVQTHSVQRHGKGSTIVGQSLGCLCEYNPPYMVGRPDDWQLAFAVFWFRPDGLFNYSVIRIFEGGFYAPNGKFYQGVARAPRPRSVYTPENSTQTTYQSPFNVNLPTPPSPVLTTANIRSRPTDAPGVRVTNERVVADDDLDIEITELRGNVADWVSEATTTSAGFVSTRQAWGSYSDWCEDLGCFALNITEFAMELSRRYKRARKGNIRGFVGFSLN